MYDTHCVRHAGVCADVRCDECPYRSPKRLSNVFEAAGPAVVTNTPRLGESPAQTEARYRKKSDEELRDEIAADYAARMGGCVTTEPKDNVVLPDHYARFKIEPITFICENKLDFFQGNIVKYVVRHDAKNGIEDLKKAKRYLEMYIKYLQDDPTWPAK